MEVHCTVLFSGMLKSFTIKKKGANHNHYDPGYILYLSFKEGKVLSY